MVVTSKPPRPLLLFLPSLGIEPATSGVLAREGVVMVVVVAVAWTGGAAVALPVVVVVVVVVGVVAEGRVEEGTPEDLTTGRLYCELFFNYKM